MKRIKFAILGMGRIGKVHADTIQANSNAELAAIHDPINNEINRLQKRYSCQQMSLDDITNNDQIKGILICTPTDTHVDLIKRFLYTKKAVFCEKPLDLNLRKVKKLVQLVSESKSQVMLGFNRRFDPHFAKLKAHLTKKEIGVIEQITITSRDPNPPTIEYIKQSGGIFKDMAIHDLDMAVFLADEKIHSITALGSNFVSKKIEQAGDYDTATILMRTISGKQISIINSRRATYGYDQRVEVHGSKGSLKVNNPTLSEIELAKEAGTTKDRLHHFFMTRYIDAYKNQIDYFVDCIKKRSMPKPDSYDGYYALYLAENALKSAKTGRTVYLS
jgi:myo-inositol 2-dehydrogenase/D-chiro-inositol 1-dehydrogenase|tara:strand:- start:482 stop:1477 length:996 start_codon:yes stop_codon:yes gene_type:complete